MVEFNLMPVVSEKKINKTCGVNFSYRPYNFLFFVFIAWFVLVILNGIPYATIDFDSAVDAVIAKSIAFGNGWNTSYGPFADNTSGDMAILPATCFTWLIGNAIWVPPFSSALINLVALLVLIFYIKRIITYPDWVAVSIALLFFFSYFKISWWYVLTGDLPSYIFFIISCFVMVDPFIVEERKRFIFVGLILGLSFCSKLTIMAGFFGIFIYTLFAYNKRDAIKNISHMVFFLLIVIVAFQILEAFLYEYNRGNFHYFDFFYWRISNWPVILKAQSGDIFSIIRTGGVLSVVSDFSIRVYREIFLGYGVTGKWPYLLLSVPPAATFLMLILKKELFFYDRLIIILSLCFLIFSFQFFIIYRTPFDHHAFYMIWTNFFIIILIFSRVFKIYGAIIFIFMCLMCANPDVLADYKNRVLLNYDSVKELRDDKKYIESMQDARNFIEKTNFRFPLANCGWLNATREIDYLLPAPVNFVNCFDLIRENYVLDTGDGKFHWKNPVNFTLVINNAYWKYAKRHKHTLARQNLLIAACKNQLLYESGYYRIMECPFENLEKVIPTDSTNPFSEALPEWADHN